MSMEGVPVNFLSGPYCCGDKSFEVIALQLQLAGL